MAKAIMRIVLFVLASSILFFSVKVYAAGDTLLFHKATEFARRGKKDFAFMYFNKIKSEFPDSKFYKDSLFASGEYCFITSNYQAARDSFNEFINNYPDSQSVFFAYAYLLKMAEEGARAEEAGYLKKKIISLKQVSLLFRNYKAFKYTSPFYRKLKALYFIDRIEFYIDDKLFQKIIF